MSPESAAVFLDRDGVLNRSLVRDGKPYPASSLAEFELFPEVNEACAILRRLGPLVVVTNQPDVGRGTLDRAVVEAIHAELCRQLPIERVEVCYEDGRDPASQFYKPAPGMLLRAARDLRLDLHRSIMIGDRWRDIECGRAAGCRTVWIDRGYNEPAPLHPDHRVADLLEAARLLDQIGCLSP